MKAYLIAALAWAWLAAAALAADAPETTEQWYVVSLQGKPSGWAVQRETVKDQRITTQMTMHIAMARGQTPIEIEIGTSFTETEDGRPISATTLQDLAMMQSRTELTFRDDGITMVRTTGGRASRQELAPVEGEWMTPAAATRHVMERIAAGDKQVTYRTFDPASSLKPINVTVEVIGPTTIESFGKTLPATKVQTSTSMMPGMKTEDYIDAEGRPIRTTVNAGIIAMTMERADKQLALAQKSPPELLDATLISPDKPIDNPRKVTRATYVLTVKQGDLPDLAATPSQSFTRIDKRSGRLTVRTETAKTDDAAPPVKRSSILDGQDPRIVKLRDEALADAGDGKAARAETLRRFVYAYIDEKTLGVGLASASEVAQTRQGDCTEHAVLLAALLRADGIPSRTASGLIYVDAALGRKQIFGYHMWTQAWLDGRWVDLDPTLGPDTAYDATHITLSVSDMDDDGWTNDLVDLAPLMGVLDIAVQHAE